MTATLPDVDTTHLEELRPPCDLNKAKDTECDLPADWVGVLKCCANTIFMCNEHHEAFLAKIAGPMVFGCPHCRSYHVASPFSSLERL